MTSSHRPSTAIETRVPSALEQRRLMHELPGAGPSPAALEERLEAGRDRVARKAPALVAHDRGQKRAGVPARAFGMSLSILLKKRAWSCALNWAFAQ